MRKLNSSEFSSTVNYLHFKELYSLNLVKIVYKEKSVLMHVPSGNFFLALSPGLYQEEIVFPNIVM